MIQVFSLVSCYLSRIFVILVIVEFSTDFFRQVFSLVSCHLSRISCFWVFLLLFLVQISFCTNKYSCSIFFPYWGVCSFHNFGAFVYVKDFFLLLMVFLSMRSVCLIKIFLRSLFSLRSLVNRWFSLLKFGHFPLNLLVYIILSLSPFVLPQSVRMGPCLLVFQLRLLWLKV